MTPYDWAWQNVKIRDVGCKSPQSLSVAEACLHPFLRKEIRNNISDSADSTIRLEAKEKDAVSNQSSREGSWRLGNWPRVMSYLASVRQSEAHQCAHHVHCHVEDLHVGALQALDRQGNQRVVLELHRSSCAALPELVRAS